MQSSNGWLTALIWGYLGLKLPLGYNWQQRIKHTRLNTIMVALLLPYNTYTHMHACTHMQLSIVPTD